MVIFSALGVVFIILGFVIKAASDGVVEYSVQYDGAGALDSACALANSSGVTRACTVKFDIAAEMKAPIFVYYQLDNFYQNHRRYVKSRSDSQLAGTLYTSSSATGVEDCAPKIKAANGKLLHPCGLIANSLFNDTFVLAGPSGFAMDETGIAWATDKASKYKAIAKANYAQHSGTVSFLNDSYPTLYGGNIVRDGSGASGRLTDCVTN